MFGVLFGLVVLVVGIIAAAVFKKDNPKVGGAVIIVAVIICVVSTLIGCFTTVETGHTGIVTTFGKVENYTLDAGLHFKAPWKSVVQMDNRVQKATVNLNCFSSDIQEVRCIYTLNYQVDKSNAQEIYRSIGISYYDTVIVPNVSEATKTIMARYTAEELIGNREELGECIEELLKGQLVKYNIEVVSTAIEDLDFTDTFTAAVEAKQVAAQNKLKAEIEQAQAIQQAEADAKVAKTEANAAAEVAKIQADAEAAVAVIAAEADLEVQKINADAAEYAGQKEAAKNSAIRESITPDLLRYYMIQQWDGKYPETYFGSDNVSTILEIGG